MVLIAGILKTNDIEDTARFNSKTDAVIAHAFIALF